MTSPGFSSVTGKSVNTNVTGNVVYGTTDMVTGLAAWAVFDNSAVRVSVQA